MKGWGQWMLLVVVVGWTSPIVVVRFRNDGLVFGSSTDQLLTSPEEAASGKGRRVDLIRGDGRPEGGVSGVAHPVDRVGLCLSTGIVTITTFLWDFFSQFLTAW